MPARLCGMTVAAPGAALAGEMSLPGATPALAAAERSPAAVPVPPAALEMLVPAQPQEGREGRLSFSLSLR